MEKMNDLKDLLKHELMDLYSVESQILDALPKMVAKASNQSLKKALNDHLRVTGEHKARLDNILKQFGGAGESNEEKREGLLSRLFRHQYVCKGMQGILEEGNKIMNEDMATEVKDAAIIAAAQKVEHYEICGYGTARTYASELGMEDVARLLEQTLNEEYAADDQLTALAVGRINPQAEKGRGQSGDRTASGTTTDGRNGRTANENARERITREEPELEAVSSSKAGSKKTGREEGIRQYTNSGCTQGRSSPTQQQYRQR